MILFVCTGNTCRSPMAELYFNELVRRSGKCGVSAASAGLAACAGDTLSRQAAEVLREQGIDGSAFRSRRFSPYLGAESELIVAMTRSHRMGIAAVAPGLLPRTRLLMDFAGGGDVPDPFGGDAAVYRSVFARMRPALEHLFEEFSGSFDK